MRAGPAHGPSSRLPAVTAKGPGTGLGLAMSAVADDMPWRAPVRR